MALEFSKRPKTRPAPLTGGDRLTWRSKCGLYSIDFFTQGSRRYIAILHYGLDREKLIGSRRSLEAAKLACVRYDSQATNRRKQA